MAENVEEARAKAVLHFKTAFKGSHGYLFWGEGAMEKRQNVLLAELEEDLAREPSVVADGVVFFEGSE